MGVGWGGGGRGRALEVSGKVGLGLKVNRRESRATQCFSGFTICAAQDQSRSKWGLKGGVHEGGRPKTQKK